MSYLNETRIKLAELIDDVECGILSPLKYYAFFKELEKDFKAAAAQIENEAKDEASKHILNGKSGVAYGFKFEMRNGRAIFDYKADPVYLEHKAIIKEREKALKHAQQMAAAGKDYDKSLPIVPVSYSKDYITIKQIEK